jgi:N-acetylated-alpha-linked acidic dipeptidase
VARDVVDPQTKVSVAERERARLLLAARPEERKELRERRDLRIRALGSGSDYTPFLQHLGVASLDLGFSGEDSGGTYHSIYDSFAHYQRFGDPGHAYGVALAQTAGRAVLRLAEADVLPFEFTSFADTLARYVTEVNKLADEMREETEETNRRLKDRAYALAADPTETSVPPPARPPVPYVSLSPLLNARARVEESARGFDAAWKARAAAGELPADTQKALDAVLMGAERSLTRAEGLPRRPWFVHQVYAPGLYTGYGVKTLPAVRESLEQREWTQAEEQAKTVAAVLEGFAAQVDRATALLAPR